MTTTYWEDPADYPSFRDEREAELKTEIETLKFDLEQAEKAIAELQGKLDNHTDALEECLEWFRDRQDIGDLDETGQPTPNAEMKMGNMVEEALGRGWHKF